jgi:hypothetical protein
MKKILKEAKGKKYLIYKEANMIIKSAFPSENMASKEIHKTLREKRHQPRILNPVKLSFKSEREVKTFSNKIDKNVANRPSL